MPDVHLLGRVRSGVVDQDPLGGGHRRHAEPVVQAVEGAGQHAVGHGEVEEPGTGDLDRREPGQVGCPGHLAGDLPGRPAELPGQREGGAGLEVGVLRGAHGRVDGSAGDGVEGRRQPGGEQSFEIHRQDPIAYARRRVDRSR